MSALPREYHAPELPLCHVLHQTAVCLAGLSERVLDLEHSIWGAHLSVDTPPPDISGLQSLDFVKQAIDDLGAMLERLAQTVPPSQDISEHVVIGQMKLEKLRKIIAPSDAGPHHPPPDDDVELF